jgi:MFS family permease
VIALSQAWIKSYGGYIATRILLGIAECGYIPGALYVISTFYKGSELATRNGAFFTGSGTASACTGLLAYGLLRLAGTNGLAGWSWLFIIEGCIALFVGLLFLLFLPHSPDRPTPLLFPKFEYFTERQRHILKARIVLDDARKHDQNRALHWHEIRRTLANPRVWPHVFISLPIIAATGAMGTYGPSLIKQLGFTTLKANALSSIGNWIGVILLVLTGFISDRLKLRGPMVIITIGFLWVWWIAFQQVSLGTDKWLKFAFITLVTAFGQIFHPLNATWLSLNQATPQERSIAMAIFVMSANTGAAVGSQILRSGDTGYRKGFRACVGIVSAGLLVAVCQHVQYRLSNRRLKKEAAVEGEKVKLFVE